VSWSGEDSEHVATCAEFPSLSHLDANPDVALRGIRKLVADVVADMRVSGEAVPEPLAERTYSGNFQTRVPPELHRRLSIEAAEAHVSLNRLVNLRLAVPIPLDLEGKLRTRTTNKASREKLKSHGSGTAASSCAGAVRGARAGAAKS
jgi:hypothetical protein